MARATRGLIPLPHRRRHRILPILGRGPPVKREPQAAAASTGYPAAPGLLRPRREHVPVRAARHFPAQTTPSRQFSDYLPRLPRQDPGRPEPNVTSGPPKDPATARTLCLTQAEEHRLGPR